MRPRPFKLERYFAQHEFTSRYLLSCSDCEALTLSEMLAMADDEARQLWDGLSLGYTESQGHLLLRQEIATLYSGVGPDQVLTCVPEEGILMAMSVMLSPGDHVIATYPGYQSLYEIASAIGCRVTHWIPREDEGWRFDVEWLRDQIRPETRLIVVNWPHNPTGGTIRREGFVRVIELARQHGIALFSDEMYRLLEFDPAQRLPPACDLYDRAISLGGMSKAFALPGLRIGWLATQSQSWLADLAAYRDYTTICSSATSEILAIIGLRAKKIILQRNLEIIRGNLALLDAVFQRHTDRVAWVRPQAGTIAFPRLLDGNVASFCSELLRSKGVLLLPGTVYDFPGQHFRVGFGRSNLPEALEHLEAFL